jgi:uncharacterized protein YkwD
MRLPRNCRAALPAALIASLIVQQGCASNGSTIIQQGAARGPAAGRTGTNYVALERGVVDELNHARTDPSGYAGEIERDLQYYQGNLFRRPGDESFLQTHEGAAAAREAIRVLRQTKPLPALRTSTGITLAARDHVNDQAPRGLMNHKGTDGSMAWDRVSRYGDWKSKISENMTFGAATAHDVISELIIDDGIADRGHRKNIFDPQIKLVGVSCGPHKSFRVMCDIVHAGGFVEHDR